MIIIFLISCIDLKAQNIDSLLQLRESRIKAYTEFKENIGERTWIRMVKLS